MLFFIFVNLFLFLKCYIFVCMGCMRVFIGRLNVGCIMVYFGNKVDSILVYVFFYNDKIVIVISLVLLMIIFIYLNMFFVVMRKMYEFNF